jgi:hypothetical protein
MTIVCEEYCCLFALYVATEYTRKPFVGMFTPNITDQQVEKSFESEFGSLRMVPRVGLCCTDKYKR